MVKWLAFKIKSYYCEPLLGWSFHKYKSVGVKIGVQVFKKKLHTHISDVEICQALNA